MFRAAVFVLCAAVRLLCTYLSQIPDCDEVFNYWEPLHYVLFGSGLQTWEYAPTFALRSYAYLVSGFFFTIGCSPSTCSTMHLACRRSSLFLLPFQPHEPQCSISES